MDKYRVVAELTNPTNGNDDSDGEDELVITGELPFIPPPGVIIQATSKDEEVTSMFVADQVRWKIKHGNEGYVFIIAAPSPLVDTTEDIITSFRESGWKVRKKKAVSEE